MHKIPIWIICAFGIMGAVALFFLWDVPQPPGFFVPNILMHGPLVAGWLYLATKEELKFRLHWFWTPLGIFIIFWTMLTVYITQILETGPFAIFSVSETPWYALAFGLLFAFYSLHSAKRFWYFMFFIAVFWNIQHISLLSQALGFNPLKSLTEGGAPPLANYFMSGSFWGDWGWFISDMIVDVPMALVSLYFILKGLYRKIKK